MPKSNYNIKVISKYERDFKKEFWNYFVGMVTGICMAVGIAYGLVSLLTPVNERDVKEENVKNNIENIVYKETTNLPEILKKFGVKENDKIKSIDDYFKAKEFYEKGNLKKCLEYLKKLNSFPKNPNYKGYSK